MTSCPQGSGPGSVPPWPVLRPSWSRKENARLQRASELLRPGALTGPPGITDGALDCAGVGPGARPPGPDPLGTQGNGMRLPGRGSAPFPGSSLPRALGP